MFPSIFNPMSHIPGYNNTNIKAKNYNKTTQGQHSPHIHILLQWTPVSFSNICGKNQLFKVFLKAGKFKAC